jgi:hypothetical protein
MKKTTVFAAFASIGLISSAQAFEIDGTEVGGLDTLECWGSPSNSGGAQDDFVDDCVDGLELVSNIGITDAGLITEGSLNAIYVGSNEPGYFLLKFGIGNDSGPNTFLFSNNQLLNYLVWSDAQLLAADVGFSADHLNSISHYAFGGGTTSVPEPATLSLLGLGILGLAAVRRRSVSASK